MIPEAPTLEPLEKISFGRAPSEAGAGAVDEALPKGPEPRCRFFYGFYVPHDNKIVLLYVRRQKISMTYYILLYIFIIYIMSHYSLKTKL
jgi:hypothetical protein